MKRAVGVLVVALTLLTTGTVLGASVTPTLIPGANNAGKTCAEAFPGLELIELKVESPFAGTHAAGTGTITVVYPSVNIPSGGTSHSIDFTSDDVLIYGVVVKDGVDGANKYDYTANPVTADTYLTTPIPTGKDISHINFCYLPDEVEEADALTITKDAAGSYDRTHTWTVDKSADDETVYTAGGADGKTDYTITVTNDGSSDGNVKVSGKITVTNPNTENVDINSITDELSDGTECVVTGGGEQTLTPGAHEFAYECSLEEVPEVDLTNTATVDWDAQTLADDSELAAGPESFESAVISFTKTDIDECVTVDDTNSGGPQDVVVCLADSPKTFEYEGAVSGPAGTCTDNDNTATISGNDSDEELDSATATVEDCQGADLIVTKTANPAFQRAYDWDIEKSVDQTFIETRPGGTATFNYTVVVSHDEGTDSNWTVTGTITIENPNDWQGITLTSLTDTVDNGGVCTVADGPYVVPAATYNDDDELVNGELEVSYSCTYASEPTGDGTNTATATWDATTAHTPTGTDSGTAAVDFSDPTTEVDECINVLDELEDIDETFCVGDEGEVDNGFTIEYSHDVTAPALGECVEVDNTATYTTVDDDNDTDETDSSSVTVEVCTFNAALTQGYWRNHLAPLTVCRSNQGCSANGPWVRDLLGDPICDGDCVAGKLSSTYTVTSYTAAKSVFDANSCSNAGSSNMNATKCLAAQLLAAELNVANVANDCICDTIAEAKAFLSAVGYDGPTDTLISFNSTYTRAYAIELKTALDNYNNGLGCPE